MSKRKYPLGKYAQALVDEIAKHPEGVTRAELREALKFTQAIMKQTLGNLQNRGRIRNISKDPTVGLWVLPEPDQVDVVPEKEVNSGSDYRDVFARPAYVPSEYARLPTVRTR